MHFTLLQTSAAGEVRPKTASISRTGHLLGLLHDLLFHNTFHVGISRGLRYQNAYVITGFPCTACLRRARRTALLLDPAWPLQKHASAMELSKALVSTLQDDCQLVQALLLQGLLDASIQEARNHRLNRNCLSPREAGVISC